MAKSTNAVTAARAEILALDVLAYLAADSHVLTRFTDLSGLDGESIRDRASEPDFLVSVLDFLLADEVLVVGFCDITSIDAKQIHLARHALGGR